MVRRPLNLDNGVLEVSHYYWSRENETEKQTQTNKLEACLETKNSHPLAIRQRLYSMQEASSLRFQSTNASSNGPTLLLGSTGLHIGIADGTHNS